MSRLTSQIRFGSSYTVDFPDFPSFDSQPAKVNLVQKRGQHDVLELTYPVLNPFVLTSLKTGALVRLRWKNDRANNEFVGHVFSVNSQIQSTQTRDTVITCIGAGLKLKEGGTKVWNNKTASEIVSLIAKDCNLKPNVTQTKVRYPQQYLSGHTHWEKVKELAYRSGFVTQVIGTQLMFHPIDKMIDAFMTSVPILSHQDNMHGAFASLEGHTLDWFKPEVGDLNESAAHTKKNKTVSGIDQTTGKAFSYSASPNKSGKKLRKSVAEPMFDQIIPERISESQTEAKAIAEAEAELAKYSIFAEGQAQGEPRIAPYKTVEINGTGIQTDGFWVITESTHTVLKDGRYLTTFKAMCDGLGSNKPSSTRPEYSANYSSRNVASENLTGIKIKQTPAKVSSPTTMINQTNTGYKVFPRKWL